MIQVLLRLISGSNLESFRPLGGLFCFQCTHIMGNNKCVAIKQPGKQYYTESFQRHIKAPHLTQPKPENSTRKKRLSLQGCCDVCCCSSWTCFNISIEQSCSTPLLTDGKLRHIGIKWICDHLKNPFPNFRATSLQTLNASYSASQVIHPTY